jgi:ribonuclease E
VREAAAEEAVESEEEQAQLPESAEGEEPGPEEGMVPRKRRRRRRRRRPAGAGAPGLAEGEEGADGEDLEDAEAETAEVDEAAEGAEERDGELDEAVEGEEGAPGVTPARRRRRRRGRRGGRGGGQGAAAAEGEEPEEAGAEVSGNGPGLSGQSVDVLQLPLTSLPAAEGEDPTEPAGDEPSTAPRRRRRRRPGTQGPPGAPSGEGAATPPTRQAGGRAPAAGKGPAAGGKAPAHGGKAAAENGGGAQPAQPGKGRGRSPQSAALRVVGEDERASQATVGPRPLHKKRRRRYRSEVEVAESRPRTMVVTKRPDRSQIAVLEEGDLVEHYVAHAEDRSIVSSIYLGRVQNVLPGMEAAFVDIGTGRNAVLYAGEVGYDEEAEGSRPRIESMLKSGQPILVQVTKDPMRHKGARLTTEISLAGRYVVFIPERESLGVSRRLSDEESERLRQITARIRPKGHGIIVRTAAEGAGEDELKRDVDNLLALWEDIHHRAQTAEAPALLYTEPELVIRVVRDLMNAEIEQVIVDDTEVLTRIRDYIADVTPDLADRISLHNGGNGVFDHFKINDQIRRGLERKVGLPSGGSIVIDRTEAMTVVDVNTGRFVGRSNLEETVLRTNLEAAEEVAKQLRLRDIGGIIVIDFIDMLYERNRDELLRIFKAALSRDKTRTQVFGVSELGLVQMTRKNVSDGLLEAFSVACDKCEGRGIILSEQE